MEIKTKPWVFAHLNYDVEFTAEQMTYLKDTAEAVHDSFHESEGGNIDWERLFERVEAHTDLDLGTKWDAPHFKELKKHIRAYRKL